MSDLIKCLEYIMESIPMPEWGYDIIENAIAGIKVAEVDKAKLTHYKAVVEAAQKEYANLLVKYGSPEMVKAYAHSDGFPEDLIVALEALTVLEAQDD